MKRLKTKLKHYWTAIVVNGHVLSVPIILLLIMTMFLSGCSLTWGPDKQGDLEFKEIQTFIPRYEHVGLVFGISHFDRDKVVLTKINK